MWDSYFFNVHVILMVICSQLKCLVSNITNAKYLLFLLLTIRNFIGNNIIDKCSKVENLQKENNILPLLITSGSCSNTWMTIGQTKGHPSGIRQDLD